MTLGQWEGGGVPLPEKRGDPGVPPSEQRKERTPLPSLQAMEGMRNGGIEGCVVWLRDDYVRGSGG